MVDSPTAIRPVRNESTAKHNDNKRHSSLESSRYNDNFRDREHRDDWGRHRDDHGRGSQSDRPRMSDHHANEYDNRNDRRFDRENRRDNSHFNDQRRYSEDHHRGRGRHVEDHYHHHSRSRSSSHHHDRCRHENENFHRNRSRSRSRSRSRDHRQHYHHNSRNYHRDDRDSSSHRDRRNNSNRSASHSPTPPLAGAQPLPPADPKLGSVQDDPRGSTRITRKASTRGNGRNTESFDPKSTLVRPHLRIQIASGISSRKEDSKYEKVLKHDDVVIVPELFGKEDDWGNYYQLVEEMREIQRQEMEGKGGEKADNTTHHEEEKKEDEETTPTQQQHTSSSSSSKQRQNKNKAEWISWHEGAHLISKNPDQSPLFQSIVKRLCHYFSIDTNKPIGTRFNWYRDSSDWKPFHHDSAAFNPARARNQNITIGVSFGATRELAFIRAVGSDGNNYGGNDEKCRLYFPQMNNGVFTFGRDANILWKHGINALPQAEQDGKGRISIILWGFAKEVVEEEGSPPLLGSNGQGPHAARRGERGGGRRNHDHGQSRGCGGSRDFQEGRGRDNRGNHPSR